MNSISAQTAQIEADQYHVNWQQNSEGVIIAQHAEGNTEYAAAGLTHEGGLKPDEKTIFEIGSVTKVFTSVLLAEAVRGDRANFEDVVSDHLTEHKLNKESPFRTITLSELATHTSGLPRLPADLSKGADKANPYAHYDEERLLNSLVAFRRNQLENPGEYSYSNYGMGILGYVLTQIYNQSFRNLLKAKILDPLNMNSTHVPVRFSDLPKSTLTCIATPHASGVVVSHWELASLVGAGAMISSAEDLIRFGTAHWDGNTPTGLAASLAEVAKPRLNDHGLGWEIHNDSLTKGGGTGGFRAHVNVNPKDKTTHVILSNSGGVSNEVTLEGEFSSMQGYWSGDLITRVRKRRLVCCINIDGRMVLYGLIRGNHPALSARSKFSDDHFYFSFPSIKTVYEGTVEDGELSGALTFSDGHCDTLTLRYSTEMPSDLRAGLHETMQGNLTSISGYWWGYLGGVKGLFIYVSITRVGELSVIELFSPDQHNQPISISTASFINDTFKIRSDQINSEFSGKLAGDGKSIKGTWNQHQSTPLTLYLSTQRPEREKRDTSAI